ncbi:MAG: hypothetical protein ACLTDV_14185 [Eubacterium sp.]
MAKRQSSAQAAQALLSVRQRDEASVGYDVSEGSDAYPCNYQQSIRVIRCQLDRVISK